MAGGVYLLPFFVSISLIMNYQQFRNRFFELWCFNSNQVYAWQPDFDKNNLGRWVSKGLLVRFGQTKPDYAFLSEKCGISSLQMLKESIAQILSIIDLKQKSKDFERLLFTRINSSRILSFGEFMTQF